MQSNNLLQFGVNLPRYWDLLMTRFTDDNETRLIEKYITGDMGIWVTKSHAWAHRFYSAMRGECSIFLAYKDERKPLVFLPANELNVLQAFFNKDWTINLRTSESSWKHITDTALIARLMGCPSERVYKDYMAEKFMMRQTVYVLFFKTSAQEEIFNDSKS